MFDVGETAYVMSWEWDDRAKSTANYSHRSLKSGKFHSKVVDTVVKSWKSWVVVSNIFDFHPDRGFMIQFDAYFSTGWQKNPLKLHGWSFHTSMFHRWVMPYHAVLPRLTWTTVMERFKAKQAVSMQVEKC